MNEIAELMNARAEALGTLLGMVDVVIAASEHHVAFDLLEKVERLRTARNVYDKAERAFLDMRLTQK